MISKELLSVVLGLHCGIKSIKNSEVIYWFDCIGEIREHSINIYELAHKCKEYALKQGYYFSIYSFNFDSNTEQEHRIRLLIGNDVVYFGDDSSMETEVEAIFKACQWILDKDSK